MIQHTILSHGHSTIIFRTEIYQKTTQCDTVFTVSDGHFPKQSQTNWLQCQRAETVNDDWKWKTHTDYRQNCAAAPEIDG